MTGKPAPVRSRPADVRGLASTLYLTGAITVVAGIALGFVLDPVLFGIAGLGLLDCVVAAMFAGGHIGPGTRRRPAALDDRAEAAELAEADATYNPYARED